MENYEGFKKSFYDLSRIDLNAYREKQMRRRIETLIERRGFNSLEAYFHKLELDKTELDSFKDYITIHVTEFFRSPEHWEFLESNVIPSLVQKAADGHALKIWSTSCSTGEEPYSLAMLFLKYLDAEKFQILATDINDHVLESAARGVYSVDAIEKVPAEFREKYFEPCHSTDSAKSWLNAAEKINDVVKRQVTFQKKDLTQEIFPADCDLIVCRNALIYFTDEIKQKIFCKFCNSLKKDGVLFLGHTEQIVYYRKFGLEKLSRNFYRNSATIY